MKHPIRAIIEYFYPSEIERMEVVKNDLKKQYEHESRDICREILLLLGFSTFVSLQRAGDKGFVLDAVKIAADTKDGVKEVAKVLRVSEEEALEEAKTLPAISEMAEKYKELASKAVDRKDELIQKRKDELRAKREKIIKNQGLELDALDSELQALDDEHIEAAREKAETSQKIKNEESK